MKIEILLSLYRSRLPKKNVVIITDIGREDDDEVALLVAAGLAKVGLLNIKGIIANYHPTTMRARLAKGVLESMGFNDVPVAIGESIDEHYLIQAHEFDAGYVSSDSPFTDGQSLLKSVCESAEDHSVTLLIISGLTDASLFIQNNMELAKKKIATIVTMSGVISNGENEIMCDELGYVLPDKSYNNRLDMPSASRLYYQAQTEKIPLLVVSRFCANPCAITPNFYTRLAQCNSPIGRRLYDKQCTTLIRLWQRTFLNADDPERDGLPLSCNSSWFLETFTDNLEEYKSLNAESNIWAYISKLHTHDPVALIAGIFPHLFTPSFKTIHGCEHQVIGVSKTLTGISNPDQIRDLMINLAEFGLTPISIEQLNYAYPVQRVFSEESNRNTLFVSQPTPKEKSISEGCHCTIS